MTQTYTPTEIHALKDLAARIAQDAGSEILRVRREGVRIADTKSSIVDVVTEADRLSEQMIADRLRAERPHDALLGEEGSASEGTTGITWVIDPIDGTVNYLYDLPAYCVSIAACVADDRGGYADGRRAIAGAVHNPRTGDLFSAGEGLGATRNGAPISVRRATDTLDQALVATGFGYTPERRAEQAAILSHLLPRVRDIRRIGSAAYDLCLVAAGRIDAYYERGCQPWDYSAGALIAHEAGALILGADDATRPGEPLLIAGHPALAEALQRVLREASRTACALEGS